MISLIFILRLLIFDILFTILSTIVLCLLVNRILLILRIQDHVFFCLFTSLFLSITRSSSTEGYDFLHLFPSVVEPLDFITKTFVHHTLLE